MTFLDRQDSTPRLLNRLRMRQIALVLAIHEQRTLRGAAAELGLSQPAATKMLHELEDALAVRLFERVGRGLQLNAAGERVTAYCQSLRGTMEALNRELAELRQGSAGRLAVGSIMAASPGRLTQVLLSIKQRSPCCPSRSRWTPATVCWPGCVTARWRWWWAAWWTSSARTTCFGPSTTRNWP